MLQVLYSSGKDNWQFNDAIEPFGGRVNKDDDPATFQLNQQWSQLAMRLSSAGLPYFVARPPATTLLPGASVLSPDGSKITPRR
jgi:hypothetical protein